MANSRDTTSRGDSSTKTSFREEWAVLEAEIEAALSIQPEARDESKKFDNDHIAEAAAQAEVEALFLMNLHSSKQDINKTEGDALKEAEHQAEMEKCYDADIEDEGEDGEGDGVERDSKEAKTTRRKQARQGKNVDAEWVEWPAQKVKDYLGRR